MEIANKLELHYYFTDQSHEIDANIRNKCEAELLALISEIATTLNIDAQLIAEAVKEGGFREFWKLIGNNIGQITVVLLLAQLMVTTIPMLLESENEELESELNRLKIEETSLNIEKLRKELKENEPTEEVVNKAKKHLSNNLKIIKRRSNFYSTLSEYQKMNSVGFNVINELNHPINKECKVPKADFRKFILSSNKLKAEEVETEIEIISPVLKEGRYKWKGIYNEVPIGFEMLDHSFKELILFENIPFQHGTIIVCVLRIKRELDEVGEVKITGYAVTTVIEKIDSDTTYETQQGKNYRHAKKEKESQGELPL